MGTPHSASRSPSLHCLSAFCPSATTNGYVLEIHLRSGLHCLSAFCPSATAQAVGYVYGGKGRLHCLSAFCPSATTPLPIQKDTGWSVSIAFRRSALRPRGAMVGLHSAIHASPLPFGVLPFGHFIDLAESTLKQCQSPLPFGVLPFGHLSLLDGRGRRG